MYGLLLLILLGDLWVEKSHSDFSDGWECYVEEEITTGIWQLGSKLFSPYMGGLKILREDWDLDDNGWMDLIVSDKGSNSVVIYWNEGGNFSPSNITTLPASRPQGISLADVNLDGLTDILVANLIPPSTHSFIYYGSENGFNPDNRDAVISLGAQQVLPADINNDGYIDLIISNSGNGSSYDVSSYIYYGPGPFQGRFPDLILPTPCAHEVSLVDINRDGYLDLIFSSERSGDGGVETFLTIYLGDPSGFNPDNRIQIPVTLNWSHSLADLNKDGFIDLVVNEGSGVQNKIFWGGEEGFGGSVANLPGGAPGQVSISDLNLDGELDVIFSEIGGPLFIWWGPFYENHLELNSTGGHGLMISDYNQDGYFDIAVADEGNSSLRIFWNSLNGFQPSNFTQIPVGDPDDCIYEDQGNLIDKSNRFFYQSSIYDTEDTVYIDSLRWWGSFPGSTEVVVWVRGGLERSGLGPWVSVLPGEQINLQLSRYIQYRTMFVVDRRYGDGFSFDSIKIYYHRPDSFPVRIVIYPDQSDSIDPGDTRSYLLIVQNLGVLEDVADLTLSSTGMGWSSVVRDISGAYPLQDNDGDGIPDTGPLYPGGGEFIIRVMVTSPSFAQEGDVDTTIVWAYSSRDTAVYDSAVLITKIKKWVTILVEPDSKDSTEPGVPIVYNLYAVNRGNFPDVPDFYLEGVGSRWYVEMTNERGVPLTDTDGDGYPDAGTLEPGDTFNFKLFVTPLPGTLPGESDTFIIWGRSSVDTTNRDGAIIESSVMGRLSFDLDVESEGYISLKGGRTYPGRVLEEGIEGDTVELRVEGTTDGWNVTLLDSTGRELLDPDENGWFELGPLRNREWTSFGIRVISFGRRDSLYIVIKARSKSYPFLRDSAYIMTKVLKKLDVHSYGNPFDKGTYFKLALPQNGKVTLKIYNRLGELIKVIIKDQYYKAGEYSLYWDGNNERGEKVVPGVYIYVLEFNGELGGRDKVIKKIVKAR
jgi:hypothetical protein